MANTNLPKDGSKVTAKTYDSIEYDRPPVEVSGVLHTRYVAVFDYMQCWVDNVQVDPETVRASAK